MNKQRNLTELVGRVVELKEDNKRYLVMPFELRGHDFKSIIGTIEGRVYFDAYKTITELMNAYEKRDIERIIKKDKLKIVEV